MSFPASHASHADPLTLSLLSLDSFLMDDKKRKRRESHNAVERRRRDTINEKINELAHLLPDVVSDMHAGHQKPNKGMILKRSVEYIRHVHGVMKRADGRIGELENALKNLLNVTNLDESMLGLSCPIGTKIVNSDILVPKNTIPPSDCKSDQDSNDNGMYLEGAMQEHVYQN